MTVVRTCVGCGARDAQGAMVRVTLRDGHLVVDRARRAGGRGAYLHEGHACVRAFTARGGQVRSLRASVARPVREAVVADLESRPSGGEE